MLTAKIHNSQEGRCLLRDTEQDFKGGLHTWNDTLIPWITTPSRMLTKETDGTSKIESLFQRAYGNTRHFMMKETKRPSDVSPSGTAVPCPSLCAGKHTRDSHRDERWPRTVISHLCWPCRFYERRFCVMKQYFPAWDRLFAKKARAFFCLEYKLLLVKWLTMLDYERVRLSKEDSKIQICWINRKQCDE